MPDSDLGCENLVENAQSSLLLTAYILAMAGQRGGGHITNKLVIYFTGFIEYIICVRQGVRCWGYKDQ